MSGLALKELESQFSIITTTKSPTTEKPTAPLKFSKLWSQAKPLAPKLERDGYRKSQLTLSRNPHIETSSGNWARVGGSWTAIEGLLEAQRRQIWELNTPEEPTLWILPLGALPDFHSGVLRKKKKKPYCASIRRRGRGTILKPTSTFRLCNRVCPQENCFSRA